jgi:hypothetical protein
MRWVCPHVTASGKHAEEEFWGSIPSDSNINPSDFIKDKHWDSQ